MTREFQQLRDMITAQPRERRPALRAAVPAALKIPDHLNPGQPGYPAAPPPRPTRLARSPPVPPGALPRLNPAAADLGARLFSSEPPNTIRCSTASAARSRSSSADCRAISHLRPPGPPAVPRRFAS